jgi:hypothetical protein
MRGGALTTRLSILRALGAIALVFSALAFAACGGDDDGGALSKEDYKKEAQEISDKYETDFESSLKNATSKDPQESLTGVKQIASSSTEAADNLDKLEPPEEFKDVHGKLVGALRTLGERGHTVEQVAEAKDEAAIDGAIQSFQQGIQDLDRVGTEFDKKVGTT